MESVLELLRGVCTGLPEVTERVSHGEPCWFAGGKKMFVMFADHHHDERVGFWCAAPAGVQDELVAAEPERFFRPPYVGHRGWLGVYLDTAVAWDEIGEIVEDAYRVVAAKRLVAELDRRTVSE
ncbi:MmcQ/YjbR family DNA-binding protein [Nocardia sp. NPDC101769]|uniref:MmcQ/YjbR family DNA-binding protein n=1 Tax=Nocardia sp. NPDC101769 TaxID=3364333 RepID=UPI003819B039